MEAFFASSHAIARVNLFVSYTAYRDSLPMPLNKNTPHFQYELGFFMDMRRAYGVGKPIGKVALSHDSVSLATLKKLMAGRHILPKVFLPTRELFNISPLNWIEAKIRYVESYLNEYLVKMKDERVEELVDQIDIPYFFEQRAAAKLERGDTRQRLGRYIRSEFTRRNLSQEDIADCVGKSGKKDRHTISRPTVGQIQRGVHIRPQKFSLVCNRLGIENDNHSVAKILYAEGYLGEFLLGESPDVFKKLSLYEHPRTAAVLVFSAQKWDVLA